MGCNGGLRLGELLNGSCPPVDEVARLCGFADEACFSRHFRRIHGLPPGQFRSQQRDPDTPQAAML
ncbi:MAG: AraC family transcriptional regulator [Pseudomonas sp.]|nr:AraC family transcriptional regulator [Pseudomonas sp.]